MIGIGRHTDYATRIVLHLASLEPGMQVTAAEVARHRLLPAPFIRRVIAQLAAAGIVRTTRGARGGMVLARPAADISLLDVLQAMEGGIVLNECVKSPAVCGHSSSCTARVAWLGATKTLEKKLRAVRFDVLARSARTASRKARPAVRKSAKRA